MIVDTTHGWVTMLVDANSRDILTEPIDVEDSVRLFKEALKSSKESEDTRDFPKDKRDRLGKLTVVATILVSLLIGVIIGRFYG